MKSSKLWIWIFIVLIILVGIVWFFYQKKSNTQEPVAPEAQNATNTEGTLNEATPENTTNTTNNGTVENTTSSNTIEANRTNTTTQVKGVFNETELSVFSTPLKAKASGRLNNIHITCDTLNAYIIENGKTFSFNQVVGKPTATKGYQEADVIINGETEKALGGGNCQVSTTIYNAALLVDGIEILERHEHGKDVSYVEDGKDAAVSYGSLDLKFINKTGKNLKLYVGTDDVYVTAQIVSIS